MIFLNDHDCQIIRLPSSNLITHKKLGSNFLNNEKLALLTSRRVFTKHLARGLAIKVVTVGDLTSSNALHEKYFCIFSLKQGHQNYFWSKIRQIHSS